MREKVSAIFGTFANLLVVVTMITVVTAIIALLPYASVHWKITWIACVAIAILGTIAVVHEIRRLYRLDMARRSINRLLAEGTKTTLYVEQHCDKTWQGEQLIAEWCTKVEDPLSRHLDEGDAYIARFHEGGSLAQTADKMTVWKNKHRLETLGRFLIELRN
jgi:hypothetical protein